MNEYCINRISKAIVVLVMVIIFVSEYALDHHIDTGLSLNGQVKKFLKISSKR